MTRTFEIKEATREAVPLIVGLTGASGSGKTGSGLEMVTGFQDVEGGDIGVLDSEAKRALHYAGAPMFSDPKRNFKFKHIPFGEPFSPLDYMAALEYVVKQGIKHVIVDSTSHMHEGSGGVLQSHQAEVERLMKAWSCSGDKANLPAWSKPKQEFDRFKNWFLQQNINFIFCFRAKEKIKIAGGKPVPMGWQAISTEGMIYEMTANFLLYPGSNGVPIWNPEEKGERDAIKLPQQFRGICTPNRAISAEMGKELAIWAKGGAAKDAPAPASVDLQPPQAPNPKPQETPGQRLVKCMALLDSATSTADLKAKGATFKDETPENRNQLAAHYEARFKELREAGK